MRKKEQVSEEERTGEGGRKYRLVRKRTGEGGRKYR